MVENLWNEKQASEIAAAAGSEQADQSLALQAYASRLIGSDLQLVQHGGGNTSCKVTRKNLFGNEISVLHIKGSGQDLATMDPAGMPGLRLETLLALRQLPRLSDADMVNTQRQAMLDSTAPTPSVETLLHAYLPHRHINHTHATAMLAIADLPNAESVVKDIFGDRIACVPFHMPGFELGKAAAEVFESNPQVEGLLLLQHGHFAFSDDPKTAYDLLIEHTNMVENWISTKSSKGRETKGKIESPQVDPVTVLPMLRGVIGKHRAEFSQNADAAMPVLDLRAGPAVQEFLARPDMPTLATRGVATPDHVIRTKNLPLVLYPGDLNNDRQNIENAVQKYIDEYTEYFNRNAAWADEPKTMLDPTPDVIWAQGLGIIALGHNAQAAAMAGDLAEQNFTAMGWGEDCGGFHPVNEAQLFDMEYWSLEQAKLGDRHYPDFDGRVVLVTGGGGAIGLATAQAFAALGASIFLVDLEQSALDAGLEKLGPHHGGIALDITAENAAQTAMDACIRRFGGLDILVSNAGAAWTGEMDVLDDVLLRKSFELNFFAHQTFSKAAAHIFEQQGRGGQILFNVSKQAVNPGKGFGAYGIPKAATFFLLRQLALELGPKGVRVNGINADRIRSGLLDADFVTERAKARGVDEATYMAGNLLRREVEARHVADAFVALAQSARTTAHVMTVDGGNIEAALR